MAWIYNAPALPPWLRQKEARAAARKLLAESSSLA